MSSVSLHEPRPDTATALLGVSSGKSVGETSGVIAGNFPTRIMDPYRADREQRDRFRAWCRANFHNSTQLGAAFCVDESTARKWMSGDSMPRSDRLITFCRENPGVIRHIFGEVAA